MGVAARQYARLREHAAREHPRTRALPVVRVRGPSRRPVRPRPRPVTARFRAVPALLAVLLSIAIVAIPALPSAAQAAAPSFVLATQSPWVAPGSGFLMRFDAAN